MAFLFAFAGTVVVATRGRGEPSVSAPCALRLVPSAAPSAWQAASVEAAAELSPNDCRDISVHLTLDGAVVVFTTADGRQAVRSIRAPSELSPTIAALKFTSSLTERTAGSAAPSAAASEAPSAAPSIDPDADVGEEIVPPPPPKTPRRKPKPERPPWLHVGLTSAFRTGFPGRFTAPTLGAMVHVDVGHSFELGLYGAWEAWYNAEDAPNGFEMYGFSGAVSFGRRFDLFDQLSLFGEVTAGAAWIEQDKEAVNDATEYGSHKPEARFGLSIGAVYPRRGLVRVRPIVSIDWVPDALSRKPYVHGLLPTPPVTSISFGLGVDVGIL